MTDIVDRLRKQTMPEDVNRLWAERNEAANVIERLRMENKNWQKIASQGITTERMLRTTIARMLRA